MTMTKKERKWLDDNVEMLKMNPKAYYRETFNEIVKEINSNEKNHRKVIICPFCNAKNLIISKYCGKCGKKINFIMVNCL